MAEVPAVEIIVRDLRQAVVGRAFTSPEALADGFGPEVLARQLRRRKAPLRTLLLNQRVLAGLGNRDADESPWRSGLDPRRTAASRSGARSAPCSA